MTEEPIYIPQNGTVKHDIVAHEGKGKMANGHVNGNGLRGPEPSSSNSEQLPATANHIDTVDTVSINISINDAPVAGPSNSRRPPFTHVQLGRSEASLVLDVTKDITYVSEDPVFLGILCDVHLGEMCGRGKVALKKLRFLGAAKDEKKEKKFRHEALVWKMLHHPYVLPFYGIYLEIRDRNRIMCLVSPWQTNGNLTSYLRANPGVNRLSMLEKIADALAYLHDNDPPVVHGDIKGQNILVSDYGEPLLCDFGLSMTLENIDPEGVKSVLPTGVKEGGSIRYMSPELIEGKQTKNVASDVFAFAMLIVEAYTLTVPFSTIPNDVTVMFAIVRGDRPDCPFSDLTSQETQVLWRLMRLCWYTEPRYRPTMYNIAYLLRSLLHPGEDIPFRYGHLPKLLSDYVLQDSIEMKDLLSSFDELDGYEPKLRIQISSPPLIPLFGVPEAPSRRSTRSREEDRSFDVTSEIMLGGFLWLIAASQIGICIALLKKFPSPQKVEAVARKLVPRIGLGVNVSLLYYESVILSAIFFVYLSLRDRHAGELRNHFDFLHRFLLVFGKLQWVALAVQGILLTGNSVVIIVFFNVKPAIKHAGKLPAICYGYEALAFYTTLGFVSLSSRRIRRYRKRRLRALPVRDTQGSDVYSVQDPSIISRPYSPEASRQVSTSRRAKGKEVSGSQQRKAGLGLPLRRMRSPGAESRSTTHTADNPPSRNRISRILSSWQGFFAVRRHLDDRDVEAQIQASGSMPVIAPPTLYTYDEFVEGSASRPDLTPETRGLQLPPLSNFDEALDFSADVGAGLGGSSGVDGPREHEDYGSDDQDDRMSTMSARQREKRRARE